MVVQFTEQKRMELNPKYACAVLHLQEQKCDLDDLELFNSRLILSPSNLNGVNLGQIQCEVGKDIAAIVDKNNEHHTLNSEIGRASCRERV